MTALIWTVIGSLAVMLAIQLVGRRSQNPNLPEKNRRRWRFVYLFLILSAVYYLVGYLFYIGYNNLGKHKFIEWYAEIILGTFTKWWVIPSAILLTVTPYVLVMHLKATGRKVYSWRIKRPDDSGKPPPNMVTEVANIKHLGLPNLFILMIGMPVVILAEELVFRFFPWAWAPEPLKVGLVLLFGIIVFAFVHLFSDYDLGTLLVMTCVPATAFTITFLAGGLNAAVQLHLGLNLVALPFYGGTEKGPQLMEAMLQRLKLLPTETA